MWLENNLALVCCGQTPCNQIVRLENLYEIGFEYLSTHTSHLLSDSLLIAWQLSSTFHAPLVSNALGDDPHAGPIYAQKLFPAWLSKRKSLRSTTFSNGTNRYQNALFTFPSILDAASLLHLVCLTPLSINLIFPL